MSPSLEPLLAADAGAVDHRAVRRAEVAHHVGARGRRGSRRGWRLTFWSFSGIVQSLMRPTVTGRSPSGMRCPDGSTSDPAPTPPAAWRSVATTAKRPGRSSSSPTRSTAHRPHEVVALLAGVLASRFDELGPQDVADVVEAGEVASAEVDLEVVGDHAPALDVDRALLIHLADEPATELDRPDRRTRTTEHALDHTLQAALQRLQTHGGARCYRWAVAPRTRPSGHAVASTIWARNRRRSATVSAQFAPAGRSDPRWAPRGPVGSVAVLLGRVAEWQTRWLQVPVRETSWGFKSPLAHHGAPAQAGAQSRFGPTSTGSFIEARPTRSLPFASGRCEHDQPTAGLAGLVRDVSDLKRRAAVTISNTAASRDVVISCGGRARRGPAPSPHCTPFALDQRGANMITPTPIRHTAAPRMSKRSGRNPSATTPHANEPATKIPP